MIQWYLAHTIDSMYVRDQANKCKQELRPRRFIETYLCICISYVYFIDNLHCVYQIVVKCWLVGATQVAHHVTFLIWKFTRPVKIHGISSTLNLTWVFSLLFFTWNYTNRPKQYSSYQWRRTDQSECRNQIPVFVKAGHHWSGHKQIDRPDTTQM